MKGALNRMRMWDSRSKHHGSAHRNLTIALLEINIACRSLSALAYL